MLLPQVAAAGTALRDLLRGLYISWVRSKLFWIDLILVDPELYLGGEELHGDLPAAGRHHHPLLVRQERPQSTAKLGWCHSNVALSIIWTSIE